MGEGVHKATVKAIYSSGESEEAEITFGHSGLVSPTVGSIRVYPNPAPGYTVVYGDFIRASLIGLSGQTMATFDGSSSYLDLSAVVPGLYIPRRGRDGRGCRFCEATGQIDKHFL